MSNESLVPKTVADTLRMTLEESGLPQRAIEGYRALMSEANCALDDGGVASDGRRTWIVPGRIEVLGKHVDYAGGRSLLCAIDRGIVVVARPHSDRTLVMRDAVRREALSIPLDGHTARTRLPWAVYPETVVRRLRRNFGDALQGCAISIASNLPPAAGVSSSSALTVGLTLAISAISRLADKPVWQSAVPDRISLAGYVGALENGHDFGMLDGEAGVGTMGGAQDQTAILNCHASQLDVFSWKPVRHERSVPFPDSLRFVIGVSGVVAAKSGGAKERYNRAARTAHHLVDAWNHASGMHVNTLAEAFEAAWIAHGGNTGDVPHELVDAVRVAANREFSAEQLEARLHQFHDETWRFVPAAAQAFADGNPARFGDIAAASQAGAERALENQIAETIGLVTLAKDHGAIAASAFGAGFGGSVWALVSASDVDMFCERWLAAYQRAFPVVAHRGQMFDTFPSPSAFELAH
jgi:galactokinase